MATRGWTSRAASSDPQVFRAPCTVILGTFARVMRRSKLRLKLRGSIGVPWRVVNTRPVSIQASPGALTVGVLLLPAELERGDAQVGKGKRGLGCLGLGLAAEELAADALDLLADVQLSGVEVDQLPGEPEQLPFAQPEDQDQDVGRVQHVVVVAGRFEELACFINGP